jgi:serine/threonine protein kinase
MSPEILEGKTYGTPTDIWALGVILCVFPVLLCAVLWLMVAGRYELACLAPPFAARGLGELTRQICTVQIPYAALPGPYSSNLGKALVCFCLL